MGNGRLMRLGNQGVGQKIATWWHYVLIYIGINIFITGAVSIILYLKKHGKLGNAPTE